MADPVEGSWYKLKADYGDSHGMIPKGSMCQVTHVFPAMTLGVGTFEEGVVVRFLEESAITGRVVQRRISVTKAAFSGLFAAGKEPAAELKRWDDAQKTTGGAS